MTAKDQRDLDRLHRDLHLKVSRTPTEEVDCLEAAKFYQHCLDDSESAISYALIDIAESLRRKSD